MSKNRQEMIEIPENQSGNDFGWPMASHKSMLLFTHTHMSHSTQMLNITSLRWSVQSKIKLYDIMIILFISIFYRIFFEMLLNIS